MAGDTKEKSGVAWGLATIAIDGRMGGDCEEDGI